MALSHGKQKPKSSIEVTESKPSIEVTEMIDSLVSRTRFRAMVAKHGKQYAATELIRSLRSENYSESEIFSGICDVILEGVLNEEYMSVVHSYVEEKIYPMIDKLLVGERTVGEVLSVLYGKYSKGIVNEAMCLYLRSLYLVD